MTTGPTYPCPDGTLWTPTPGEEGIREGGIGLREREREVEEVMEDDSRKHVGVQSPPLAGYVGFCLHPERGRQNSGKRTYIQRNEGGTT